MTLTRDFLLGVFPVTQGQYRRLMGNAAAPYFDGNDAVPMENVTWLDAVHFCNALSEVEGLRPYFRIEGEHVTCHGGTGYRLPTEAQGSMPAVRGHRNATASATTRRSWVSTPGSRRTRATRSSRSGSGRRIGSASTTCTATSGNGAGTGSALRPSACLDPEGPERGTMRVLRGGSWYDPGPSLCSSARLWWEPNDTGMTAWKFGFRVAREEFTRTRR